MKLLLIRGLPGSGKTTKAKNYALKGYHHHETDQEFVDSEGVYRFDPKKLSAYHANCFLRVKDSMEMGANVVVSNTFTRHWEMDPYVKLAERCGYSLRVETATGNYGSVHGVPNCTIEAMRARWED